jgi:hypothetical protein
MTSSTAKPSPSENTLITVHPLRPNDPECITQAEIFLRKVCHRDNVKRSEATNGEVSWTVTLTDREVLPILYESPWFELDFSTKMALRKFIRRNEEDHDAEPFYTIHAKNYKNDAETKATREFLKTKVTNSTRSLRESKYPGTNHIYSWDEVQLSDAAKEEVEAYLDRRDSPLEPRWPMYDDGKVPYIKDSDWK